MRRMFAILMSAVMTMLALAGCSSGSSGTKTDPAATPSGGGPSVSVNGPNLERIQKRGKLIVGVKHDVPKFGYKDPETNKVDGYEIDLIRNLAKAILGDENAFETQHVTAQTRVELLNAEAIDLVVATMTITEERKQQVDFSPVYYTDGMGLLVRRDSGVNGLKDLHGKPIGVLQGSTGQRVMDKAKELGATVQVTEFASYPDVKKALLAGTVDAMVTDGAILAGYVDAQTVLLPERYSKEPYGIATKKGSDDIRQVVEQVVSDLAANGGLAKLQDKWGIRTTG